MLAGVIAPSTVLPQKKKRYKTIPPTSKVAARQVKLLLGSPSENRCRDSVPNSLLCVMRSMKKIFSRKKMKLGPYEGLKSSFFSSSPSTACDLGDTAVVSPVPGREVSVLLR